MRAWIAAALLALAGCNLVFGLDEATRQDGGGDDDDAPVPDGGDDADRPDGPDVDAGPLGPWLTPRHVIGILLATDERAPALSVDGEELYFAHDPGGGDHGIYRSARAGMGWGPFTLVTEVSASGFRDDTPRFSPEGNLMYLTSDRPGGQGAGDGWAASRLVPGAPWSAAGNIPDYNTPANDRALTPCSDPGRHVFAADRLAAGNLDLYELTDDTATLIDVAASNSQEDSPFLSPDCLTLYYTSNQQGSYDLYVAHRDNVGQPFANPTRIAELSNTENDEIDPWVSPDGRHILYAAGEGGRYDLFEAFR